MGKVNKLLCSLITILVLITTYSANALTIKETPLESDNYDTIENGTFVIGITKFDPDVTITASRVTKATYNDVLYNIGSENYEGVYVYYYTSGYWFRFDDQNNFVRIQSTDPEYEKLNNLDIYYVNNEEKTLDVPYIMDISENKELIFRTDNNKAVTFDGNTLHVPATVRKIDIYEKAVDSDEVKIGVLEKENRNDDTFVPTTLVNLSEVIANKADNFIEAYYNKYNNGDVLTEVDDNVFYVNLGKYFGSNNPTSLAIGNEIYDVSETPNVGISKSMSIGMNAKTYVPVWKIVNGDVLVALTWLSVDAMPNQATDVMIGGQTFIVNVYGNSTSNNVLTVTRAGEVYGPVDYDAIAEINGNTVDFYYTHGAQALGIELSLGNEAVTEANQIIFRKASNGDMGITTTEAGYTYALYFHYNNAAITTPEDYVKLYKLALPGKGVIHLNLVGHAVTEISQ